ncbi:MAG: YecA family protein [Gammaproteobacteria bacterium]|nr:MAG: YecA family protein [Gammaproteobacteria bacterium]
MKRDELDYEAVEASLVRAESDLDAAEVHGLFCGLLCATGRIDEQAWHPEVFEHPDPRNLAYQKTVQLLRTLAEHTHAQMYDAELGLVLLLPDDEAPLGERLEAMLSWIHGFLFGLGLGGLDSARLPEGEAREFVHDLTELVRAEIERGTDNEENEQAFAEILEYLRMGTLLLHETLQPVQAPTRLQ